MTELHLSQNFYAPPCRILENLSVIIKPKNAINLRMKIELTLCMSGWNDCFQKKRIRLCQYDVLIIILFKLHLRSYIFFFMFSLSWIRFSFHLSKTRILERIKYNTWWHLSSLYTHLTYSYDIYLCMVW